MKKLTVQANDTQRQNQNPSDSSTTYTPERLRRPTGVVILAVMEIVTGAIFLIGGMALLTFAARGSKTLYAFGMVHLPIGISFLILGGASLLSASRWVWILGLALSIISIIDDAIAFAIIPLPFDGMIGTAVVQITALIVLYYLARADVRSFFGGRRKSRAD